MNIATLLAILLLIVASSPCIVDFVTAVRKRLRIGCVHMVHGGNNDLLSDLRNVKIQKIAARNYLQVSTSKVLATPHCKTNRHLLVAECDHCHRCPIIQQIKYLSRISDFIWILLLRTSCNLDDMFEDVNIPFDCEFLVAEFNGARNVILTELYRISPSFPLQRNRYGKWTPHGGLDLANDVLYSRRNNLQGLLFRTLVDKAVVNNMSDEHNYEKYRYFYQVWRELSIKMNFTIEFLPRETHGNGILLKNGSWNGVVGFLQRREANATIMSVSMTAARSRVLDFVGPIFTAKKYLIIRDTDSFETSWTSFLEPLDDSLWMVLVGTMGLLAIFVWISHRALFILKGTLQSYDVGYALLFVWGKFCNQGDSATSDFTPIRIKALTTHLTATLIIAAYSGALVSHLAVRRTQLPFNTFREFLLEGQFSLGMHKFSSLLPFFQNNTDPVIRQLYLQNVVPYLEQLPNSNMNGLRKVCSAPKYAFIYTQEYMNEVQSRLDCKLIVIPQAYISWIKSICLTKNSPYLGLFRHTLSKLRRDGVLQKLALDAQQNSPVQEPAVLSMDMVITAPVFAALSVGVAASIMSFICELAALRYFTHCRQRARGAETRNKNMSLFPA